MAKKSKSTFQKREKERARQQKQKDKEQRRLESKRGALTACRASKAESRIAPGMFRGRKRCHRRGIRPYALTGSPGGSRVNAF